MPLRSELRLQQKLINKHIKAEKERAEWGGEVAIANEINFARSLEEGG